MEKFLRELYKRYLNFRKFYFVLDAQKNSTSLGKIKIPKNVIEKFYDNYCKFSFLNFVYNLKTIIYSKNVFEFILKTATEDWDLWPYLKFLEKEKIIKVNRNGTVSLLKKEITKIIPAPLEEEQIKTRIEKKLKLKLKENDLVINLFKDKPFKVKGAWDQMPISQGSAIFVVKKILDYLPLNEKFLFVGDDDFISLILGIASPEVESLVIDADQELLDCIDNLAKKFNLKIKTKRVDITKEKHLESRFTGFLVNPVYTEDGVKEFVKFGKNQLGNDGGFGFLEVGDESIGNRFLFLQDFFAKNNLIIQELIKNKVYYPYIELYKEDQTILKRLSSMIDEEVIKSSPKLGASLYVFEYVPFKIKRINFKKPMYAYL
jgi:predicted methyltransferase